MFKVGQKVVCIGNHIDTINGGILLRKNEIYEIKRINTCICGCITFDVGVTRGRGGTECVCLAPISDGYLLHNSNRFRPLNMNYGKEVCEQLEKGFKEKETLFEKMMGILNEL